MNPEQKKSANLQDLLNYKVDTHIVQEDLEVLRGAFASYPELAKIIRKVMLPSVGDTSLPPEEMASDIWLNGMDWSQVSVEEAKALIVARQLTIKFIMGGLIKLKILAVPETKENSVAVALRNKQNSAK